MSDLNLTLSLEIDGAGGATRREAQLVLAFECDRPDARPIRYSLTDITVVTLARGAERSATQVHGRRLAIEVPDRRMSSSHAELVLGAGGWSARDLGSKNGTLRNGKPIEGDAHLEDGDVLQLGHTIFLFRSSAETRLNAPPAVEATDVFPESPGLLATLVARFAERLARLRLVAGSPLPVVLSGETGTGKEVVARAVHTLSGRGGDFVAVNCGAIPAHLVESELFGYRKGAFSGAIEDRPGLLRASDGGTLFLDELGELPLPAQAALLRVLQEREVMAVGATRPVRVDLRVIAATNRDLDALVAEGRFRTDLLARLRAFSLTLPPLRDRREDLGLLIAALLAKLAPGRPPPSLTFEAAAALFRHGWPLNIRELEQCLRVAHTLAENGRIELRHLPESVQAQSPAMEEEPRASMEPDPPLEPEERAHRDELIALLRAHEGNVNAVAVAVGKARMQVYRWLRRYGLRAEDYRPTGA